MSTAVETPAPSATGTPPWWAWAAMAFVFVAVVLEFLGGQYSNSQVDGVAARLHPLAWSTAGRVVWWLSVATAAGVFRYGERRAGIRRSWIVILASIVPFLVFAYGIATGASFSTWH